MKIPPPFEGAEPSSWSIDTIDDGGVEEHIVLLQAKQSILVPYRPNLEEQEEIFSKDSEGNGRHIY